MDKMMEEDLKGLEEEIDDAVDRLFVEKQRGGAEGLLMDSQILEPSVKSPVLEPAMKPRTIEPPLKSLVLEPSIQSPVSEPSVKSSLLEPSYEFEKMFDLESSPPPPSIPVPFLKSIEKMEVQLLSLEWEITEEKLKKTKEEVLALRELMKQKTDIASLLTCMDKVLAHMIKNVENIRPPWIKFLLDSKETIKLLLRKETEGEINVYKQLALLGIEARFYGMEGIKEAKSIQPPLGKGEGMDKARISVPGEKKIEDMSNKLSLFMEKAEDIFRTMKQQISRLEETTRRPPGTSLEARSRSITITIFKVDEKLLGGFRIEVNDEVIDLTLKNKAEKLQEHLTKII